MILELTEREEIRRQAWMEPDKEICGVVYHDDRDKKNKVFQIRNISGSPENHFEMDPIMFTRCLKRKHVIGIYHSQSSVEFSEMDKVHISSHGYHSFLYSKKCDKFNYMEPIEGEVPFVGIPFEMGTNDCYTLAQKYYKKYLGIELGDYDRDENWFEEDPLLIERNYKNEGFFKLEDGDLPKKHDAIMLTGYKTEHATHPMIYVGDNLLLHHPRDKYSTYDIYTEARRRWTAYILRHESQR